MVLVHPRLEEFKNMKIKEKKERALGINLRLKAHRCASPKCALVRNPYPPGVHGKKKKFQSLSEYGLQLKEKQKLKLFYDIDERNLRRIFKSAQKEKESTIIKLIEFLERRLNNVVFKLGFALSIRMARNLIRDGHILVNGKKVRVPSYEVKINDLIALDEKVKNSSIIQNIRENLKTYESPPWLEIDKEKLVGKVISLPQIDLESLPFEVEPIIDLFAR